MRRADRMLLRLSSVGLEFALSLGVGGWGGDALDGLWDTRPWLTLLGVFLGLGAGYRAIYRALKQANRLADEEAAEEAKRRRRYHDRP